MHADLHSRGTDGRARARAHTHTHTHTLALTHASTRTQVRAICVEAEPGHLEMLRDAFWEARVPDGDVRVVNAAIGRDDGTGFFTVGNARGWWGQRVVAGGDDQDYPVHWQLGEGETILSSRDPRAQDIDDFIQRVPVEIVSLPSLLKDEGVVDLINFDCQGAEETAIRGALGAYICIHVHMYVHTLSLTHSLTHTLSRTHTHAHTHTRHLCHYIDAIRSALGVVEAGGANVLDRVKTMIISTHSTELDHAVFAMLCSQGWRLIFSLPSMLGRPFPDDDDKFFLFLYGRVVGRAQDGLQVWVNPRHVDVEGEFSTIRTPDCSWVPTPWPPAFHADD